MSRSNLVRRTEAGLSKALDAMAALEHDLHPTETADPSQISQLHRINGQLLTAKCILTASRMRRESRASYDRADYPAEKKPWHESSAFAKRKSDLCSVCLMEPSNTHKKRL